MVSKFAFLVGLPWWAPTGRHGTRSLSFWTVCLPRQPRDHSRGKAAGDSQPRVSDTSTPKRSGSPTGRGAGGEGETGSSGPGSTGDLVEPRVPGSRTFSRSASRVALSLGVEAPPRERSRLAAFAADQCPSTVGPKRPLVSYKAEGSVPPPFCLPVGSLPVRAGRILSGRCPEMGEGGEGPTLRPHVWPATVQGGVLHFPNQLPIFRGCFGHVLRGDRRRQAVHTGPRRPVRDDRCPCFVACVLFTEQRCCSRTGTGLTLVGPGSLNGLFRRFCFRSRKLFVGFSLGFHSVSRSVFLLCLFERRSTVLFTTPSPVSYSWSIGARCWMIGPFCVERWRRGYTRGATLGPVP